jgi:hypothetical protein
VNLVFPVFWKAGYDPETVILELGSSGMTLNILAVHGTSGSRIWSRFCILLKGTLSYGIQKNKKYITKYLMIL